MARFELPARLLVATILCAMLVSAQQLPPLAKVVGGVPMVVYLPGRCVLAAIFPRAERGGETQVLAAALSLALVVLLGLLLNQMHALGPVAWLQVLAGLCGAGCIVGAVTSALSTQPFGAAPARVRLGSGRVMAVVVATVLAGLAYAQASRAAMAQRPDLYTDLWMVPAEARLPDTATLGVKNQEGKPETYALEIVARGKLVRRIPAFSLADGGEKTFRVALPSVTFADDTPKVASDAPPTGVGVQDAALVRTRRRTATLQRVEARLYKGGDRDEVYRRVWVALPTPSAPPATGGKHEATLPTSGFSFTEGAVDGPSSTARSDDASGPTTTTSISATPAAPTGTSALKDNDAQGLGATQSRTFAAAGGEDVAHDWRAGSDDAVQSLRSPSFAPRIPHPDGSPSTTLE